MASNRALPTGIGQTAPSQHSSPPSITTEVDSTASHQPPLQITPYAGLVAGGSGQSFVVPAAPVGGTMPGGSGLDNQIPLGSDTDLAVQFQPIPAPPKAVQFRPIPAPPKATDFRPIPAESRHGGRIHNTGQ
jgi:hypothetical protein